MTKKQKRSVSSGSTSPVVSSTPSTRTATRTAAPRASYVAEFNPDYTPIISDLKKIGILAGTFITILVVMSFFLR
jgi:hypothetical protein